MKRAKRIVITAIKQIDETRTHREFFSVPLQHSEDATRAIRFRFARKHSIEQDQVTVEQAAERVRYRTPSCMRRTLGTNDAYNEERAIAYAKWLAVRDGITIPKGYDSKTRIDWSGVYEGRTYRKRIRAVEWGNRWTEEIYNTRKDGRRGAYSHTVEHFDAKLRVEIPHWAWLPAAPAHTVDCASTLDHQACA